MGRPRKWGNDFFSLDTDFFSDKKIKILKARYGADGITLYLYLLCEIYKNGYYLKIDDDFKFIVSNDLNMNIDKVQQILTFLLERSLFDNKLFQSDAVLTSTGIQKRYQLMVKSRAVKNPVNVEGYWLLSEEDTEPFIKVNPFLNKSEKNHGFSEKNSDFSRKNAIKETKRNERKRKENIRDTPPALKANNPADRKRIYGEFKHVLLKDAEMQKLIGQYGKDMTDKAVAFLDEYIERKGYRVNSHYLTIRKWVIDAVTEEEQKEAGRASGRKGGPANKFNNFEQRDYDYKALERELLKGEPGQ